MKNGRIYGNLIGAGYHVKGDHTRTKTEDVLEDINKDKREVFYKPQIK